MVLVWKRQPTLPTTRSCAVFSEKLLSETFYERVAWNDGRDAFTAPVGRLRSNAFGLYDMEGNVREHCQDWFNSPYETARLSVDPAGPRSSIYGRVQRGGAWSFGRWSRASHRGGTTLGTA